MKSIAIILLAGLVFACNSSADQQAEEKPNIIVIYVDDLGYGDLSCYGGDIPTPSIDQIAGDGIRFTDFYVGGPVCTPSRYSLLTGCYPNRSKHGLDGVLFPYDTGHLDESETTIAEVLKTNGYHTALIGKWHLGLAEKEYLPENHGFDLFTGHTHGCIDYFYHGYGGLDNEGWYINHEKMSEEGYATDLITNHGIKYIEERKVDNQPFFLYLSYNAPHFGKSDANNLPPGTLILNEYTLNNHELANTLQAPEDYLQKFEDIEDVPKRYYSAMVSYLDSCIGSFTEALDRSGLYDNTMIWFISDNGGYVQGFNIHGSNGPLKGEKGILEEGGIRVAAMVSWKDRIEAGQVRNQAVCNIDLFPTFCNIVNCDIPEDIIAMDGIDISNVLFENATIERELFWKFKRQTAIRIGKWKLFNGNELYDLDADIGEKNNLADEYPEKAKELSDAYSRIENSIAE